MYGRSAFEHSPRTLPLLRSRQNVPSFVFNLLRTLSSLAFIPFSFDSVACALFSQKTGGTLGVRYLPNRNASSLLLLGTFDFRLSTLNSQLPFLNPLFPPLTNSLLCKPFACHSYENQGGVVGVLCFLRFACTLPHSNLSLHRLQSSLCPTCPGANCEVIG
jgi:hypothetical protein